MPTVFILYVPYNCKLLKKETISTQYTLEYVTWPHEAKSYVYSILMEVSVLRRICGVLTKLLTLLRFVFKVLRN